MNDWKKTVPLLLLCVYFIKVMLQPPTLIDSSILLVLSLISCYFEYQINNKKLKQLEEKFNDLTKDMINKKEEIDSVVNSIRSSVTSMKLGSSLRPTANVNK